MLRCASSSGKAIAPLEPTHSPLSNRTSPRKSCRWVRRNLSESGCVLGFTT
ncbi:hypothetical protein [Laspinema olomoucense]|uniref:hypothetical protein n=1 Tax=Laspinema olomoucense TaxID=3231600 RepID=UPI0021BB0037|nr:hypothetical protein [Laspinema sp. D3b]